jgi:hypothetical protein
MENVILKDQRVSYEEDQDGYIKLLIELYLYYLNRRDFVKSKKIINLLKDI